MKGHSLIIILIVFCTFNAATQTPQNYTSFDGTQLSRYAWQGNKVMLLSASNILNAVTMNKIVLKLDTAYNYYAKCT